MSSESTSPGRVKSKKRKIKNETQSDEEQEEVVDEQLEPKKKKMKKEARKSKTVPADWPYEDILTLFERVESLLPKVDTMRYTRRLEKIDWDKVKFGEYSSAECSSVFNTMIKRVRLRPSVSDLISNMKAMHERQPKLLMGVCGPKKPLTAYFLFVQDKQKKLKRKNPHLTTTDLSKVLSEKYKNLSPRKKQKYFDMYQANVDAYKAELAKFNEENPDMIELTNNGDGKLPKCPTPSALFIKARAGKLIEDNPGLTVKQAHDQAASKWKKLKDKKKLKWIKEAVQSFNDYLVEAAEYQRTHPSFVPKTTCLTRNEQTLKELSEGMPPKPPQSGYQLYKKARYSEVHRNGESFAHTNSRIYREWQNLSEAERESYKNQVKRAKAEYSVAFSEYLESHPEVKAAITAEKNTPKKKKKEPLVNGHINEEGSDEEGSPNSTTTHKVGDPVRSALSYFIEEQSKDLLGSDSDASESDVTVALTKKFKQLPEEQKEKYRAMAAKQRKQTLNNPYVSDLSGKKKKKNSSLKTKAGPSKTYPGEPKKPPKSGYSLYSWKMLAELTNVPSNQRLSLIGQKWKELSDVEKDAYNRKAKKKVAKYAKEVEAFKQTLTETERADYEEVLASRGKKK